MLHRHVLITLFPAEFSDVAGTGLNRTDYVVISIILFFTMWFSFFSEALARHRAGRRLIPSKR